MNAIFEIQKFHVILEHVICVYPIEEELCDGKIIYIFSFKFSNGFYEKFNYGKREDAYQVRDSFIKALEEYRKKK